MAKASDLRRAVPKVLPLRAAGTLVGEGTLVVFDGYDHPTTKNMTHQRRSAGKVGANTQNKKQFITLLRGHLEDSGCRTLQADGDADVLIIKTSVSTAAESPTVLVGDDTDLLVLLCFYTRQDGCDLFFRPEPKSTSTQIKVWNMRRVQTELGSALCNNILFLHAISGCDTTSRPFGIGKSAPLKKFCDFSYYREQARKFDAVDTCADDVVKAGENAQVAMYGGRQGESLDSLRHCKYHEKVCTKGRQVEPQNLPPTSGAARFHSMRVFLQVKQWQGEDRNLSIEDWGWKLRETRFVRLPPNSQQHQKTYSR